MAKSKKKAADSAQVRRLRNALAREKAKSAALAKERSQARAQQAATAAILRVISRSPSDAQPVFNAIVNRALRLIEGHSGTLWRVVDGMLHLGAYTSTSKSGDAALQGGYPRPVLRSSIQSRVIRYRAPFVIPDTETVGKAFPRSKEMGRLRGYRSVIAVPILHGNNVWGGITVTRKEPGRFDKHQIDLLEAFAEQGVIAIENVRRFNETKEALEQQTAISEVLRVISGSPADVQPVLEAVAVRAAKICEASDARIALVEGDQIRHVAGFGDLPPTREYVPLERGAPIGRAVIDRATVYIQDIQAETSDDFALAREIAAKSGWRSNLVVPLMRKDGAVGAIALRRRDVRPFTPKQISLLQTFADQAAIAIENVRLLNDTKEALEQQTATAEILKVISGSPTEVQPVFDAIAQSAVRLCSAMFGAVFRYDGELVHFAAHYGFSREALALIQSQFPRLPRGFMRHAIVGQEVVNSPDVLADERLANRELVQTLGHRSVLAVPMLRDGQPIGGVIVFRKEVGLFADAHVNLLTTFADQAVIAIENVRLFTELDARNHDLTSALEQQTATGELLKVIGRSMSDLQPVFETLVESAVRLCDAERAVIHRFDGQFLRLAAGHNLSDELREFFEQNPIAPGRGSNAGRAALERRTIHNLDVLSDPDYTYGGHRVDPYRTVLAVPMLKAGEVLGVILIYRHEVRAFSDGHIALMETFARQAVIAIENVRLFNETKEALERQTATAEILGVISSSPTDTQPVFDTIASNAERLCESDNVAVFRVEGNVLRMVAESGPAAKGRSVGDTIQLTRTSLSGRAVLESRTIHIHDLSAEPDAEWQEAKAVQRVIGFRTALAVPLMREGAAIGVIFTRRMEVRPFSDKQVALLKTFADQAVIAIENVRLFNETKEALERQTATAEILKVIGSSPTDTQPVFDAIVQSGLRLFPGATVSVTRPDGDLVHMVASAGEDPANVAETRARFPIKLSRDYLNGAAILDARMVDLPDAELAKDGPFAIGVANFIATGNRAMTVMPMIRGDAAIGTISVTRSAPGPLSEKQVALLRIFADQAVIAIENVRLFNETKEALERQTATAEILKVISSSPTDTQPVFDAIVHSCLRLFSGMRVVLALRKGDVIDRAAYAGLRGANPSDELWPLPLDDQVVSGRAILRSELVHIPDVNTESWVGARSRQIAARVGYRSMISAPMMRAGSAIGAINVLRAQPGVFDDKQIALLRTFADQAVIAIENVRLFKELHSRTEALTKSVGQLTALGEVGQAISSTLELETVLKTIATHAVRLTGLDGASIYEYDEANEAFRLQAADNIAPELLQTVRNAPIRKGDGTVGKVAITLEPIQVPDILDEGYQSTRKEILVEAGYRAVLTVPLLREEHIIGALSVTRKTPGPFGDEIVELLKTFATQSAMAIQNARLFREIAEKGKQLEVASQHKSQFLASMSHELRTPLNALLGFNEMILGDVYGQVPSDMQPPLAQMQTSGKHLLRLINNVLDLAKIEAGRMELALSDYSVQDTVEAVRSTLRPLATEKGIELLTSVPADVPLAYGDPGRITQCLMNLAGNSLKFTKAGKVEISVAENGKTLTYRVADTGIGIPPDKMESLFTEFKQTDATIASEYGGTGLGLSISKKFVEMHGGRIWVESTPGQGSTFSFEIPLRAGEGKPA